MLTFTFYVIVKLKPAIETEVGDKDRHYEGWHNLVPTSYMLLVGSAHAKRRGASFFFQILTLIGSVVVVHIKKMLGELLFRPQVV